MGAIEIIPISIGRILFYFVVYLVTHIGIGQYQKHIKQELVKKPKDKDLNKLSKIVNILFNWYPALFVIITLITL